MILVYINTFSIKFLFSTQEKGNSLEGEGRERFIKAVDTVHNYMTKKILGTLRKEDTEFMESLQGR